MQEETALATIPEGSQSGSKAPKARVHSVHVLPSDRHNFNLHFEILKRYVIRSRNGQEGVPAEKIEGEGIPVQAAQMNVRFLRDIGLLTISDRAHYLPTPETIKFVNARSVDENRARPILREIIAKTWFAELAQEHFRLDPVMSEDRFIGELALACETDKTKKSTALKVILEYLVYTGILVRDEKGLSLASPATTNAGPPSPPISNTAPADTGFQPDPKVPDSALPAFLRNAPSTGDWRVLQTDLFQVRVKEDLDALEELADFLATLKASVERKLAKQKAAQAAAQSTPSSPSPPAT